MTYITLTMEHSVPYVLSVIMSASRTVDFNSVISNLYPDFSDKFAKSIIDVFCSEADLPTLEKKLTDIYIQNLEEGFSYEPPCDEHNLNRKECLESGCISLGDFIWSEPFQTFVSQITIKYNKNFLKFDFARDKLPEFAELIDEYLKNFCSSNQCNTDSPIYKAKIGHLKNSLESRIQKLIDNSTVANHSIFCMDDGYAFDAPSFWECPHCVADVKFNWSNIFIDYVYDENAFLSFYLLDLFQDHQNIYLII